MKNGVPKIADFGLARTAKKSGVTTQIGTEVYWSP